MSAHSSFRTLKSMSKMAPGTMGGESRVATPVSPRLTVSPPSDVISLGCPELIHTFDDYPWWPTAVCTWANGTRISVLNSGDSEIHTFTLPSFSPLTVYNMDDQWPGWGFMNPNMCVTDDGVAFFWGADGTGSNLDLYSLDLTTGVASRPYRLDDYPGGPTTNNTDGPSYNPYDGYIYDNIGFLSPINEVRLVRIDPSNPSDDPETVFVVGAYSAVENVGESIAFTRDGAIWISYSNSISVGASPVRILNGADSYPDTTLEASSDGAPIPYGRDSVYFPTVSPTGGAWVVTGTLDGSGDLVTQESTCDVWDLSPSGTARVSTGTAGFSVFLYPTVSGASTNGHIYKQRHQ